MFRRTRGCCGLPKEFSGCSADFLATPFLLMSSPSETAPCPPAPLPPLSVAPLSVELAALSDLGMRRLNNQDSVTVVQEADLRCSRGHFLMVADGMGAHAAGELASKMAVDFVPLAYRKALDLSPPAALRKAVHDANDAIYAKGQSSPDLHGMGTTCSCLALLDRWALVAHVGDSRVYRLRGSTWEQLTFDHSLVWEMAAANQTTADKIPACIPKNVITRSLGPHPKVNVDLEGPHTMEPGDVFLLCSDGLSGVVEDELIGAIVGAMPPNEAAQSLVDLANLRGGPDNISIVIARVGEPAPSSLGEAATTVAQAATAVIQPWVWTVGAVCLAGLMWFSSKDLTLGVFASGLGLAAAMFIGMMQRHRWDLPDGPTSLGGPYGNGPYRQWTCAAGEAATAALLKVVDELGALESSALDADYLSGVDWEPFHAERKHADAARANGNHAECLAGYSAAIRALMGQVRNRSSAATVVAR